MADNLDKKGLHKNTQGESGGQFSSPKQATIPKTGSIASPKINNQHSKPISNPNTGKFSNLQKGPEYANNRRHRLDMVNPSKYRVSKDEIGTGSSFDTVKKTEDVSKLNDMGFGPGDLRLNTEKAIYDMMDNGTIHSDYKEGFTPEIFRNSKDTIKEHLTEQGIDISDEELDDVMNGILDDGYYQNDDNNGSRSIYYDMLAILRDQQANPNIPADKKLNDFSKQHNALEKVLNDQELSDQDYNAMQDLFRKTSSHFAGDKNEQFNRAISNFHDNYNRQKLIKSLGFGPKNDEGEK